MSLNEYARHRGVYPRAVETAIKAARITRDEYGLIDSGQADRDWLAHTPPERTAMAKEKGRQTQAQRKKLGGKLPAPAPQGPSAAAGRPSSALSAAADPGGSSAQRENEITDIANYQRDRAEREKYNALNARLTYEIRLGKYVLKEQWVAAETEFYRLLRDALLAVPDRMADELAATAAPARVRELLDREIRDALDRATEEKAQRRKVIHGD